MNDRGMWQRAACWIDSFRRLLGAPIDGASLAVFRICLGCAMIFECWFYLSPTLEGPSLTTLFFVDADVNFSYQFFWWVRPLPAPWIYVHIAMIGVTGAMVAMGLFYRAASVFLAVLFTWLFLLEETLYLNHFYLMSLMCWLMVLMPATQCWSVDRWIRSRRKNRTTKDEIPFWPIFLLRSTMFLVYFYAGIAKLHSDWMVGSTMMPQGAQLSEAIGTLLSIDTATSSFLSPARMALFLCWGGIVFDLSIGFLLIIRRTRYLALSLAFLFHASNHFMFNIGVFPFLAFGATLLFCEPDWPRAVIRWIRRPSFAAPQRGWMLGGIAAVPPVGALLGWKAREGGWSNGTGGGKVSRPIFLFVAAWVVIHTLLPLRHYVIPGDANWTTEAHRFSWRMMLYRKRGTSHLDIVDRGLLREDEYGTTRMDWSKWPAERDRVTHVEINSDIVNWNDMPQVLITFEPVLGHRILWNSRGSDQSAAATEQEIRDHWRATYGRDPQISPTIELVEVIRRLHQSFKDSNVGSTEAGAKLLQMLSDNYANAVNLNHPECPPEVREMMLIQLNDDIQSFALTEEFGDKTRKHLSRVDPLALLTGLTTSNLFVVHDPALQKINENQYSQIDWKQWKDEPRVFIDMTKTRYMAFLNLPTVMVCQRGEQARIEWNICARLRPRQIERLAIRPYLLHQYSNHIANEWSQEFGRRPAVFATSYVALNHHAPQLLIDPQVDLASTKLRLFGRNEWTLMLDESRAASERNAPMSLGSSDAPPPRRRGDLRDGQLVQNVTRWYATGQKLEEREFVIKGGHEKGSLTSWYEEGGLRLRAPFVNGMHDGCVQKWHPNGNLAIEVHYASGVKQGSAKLWSESGDLTAQAHYEQGVKTIAAKPPLQRQADGGPDADSLAR